MRGSDNSSRNTRECDDRSTVVTELNAVKKKKSLLPINICLCCLVRLVEDSDDESDSPPKKRSRKKKKKNKNRDG